MKSAGIVISICIALLVGMGLVAIASVSDVASAGQYHGDAHRMLRMQLLFAGAGLALAIAAARTPPSFWFRREVVATAALLALVGLVIVHVPGLADPHKGSWRWIAVGRVRGQPSEFVKLAAILVTAWWVGDPALDKRRFVRSALVPAAWLGVLVLGLMAQPDLGSSAMLLGVNGAILFVGGVRFRYLCAFAVVGLFALGVYVLHNPERLSRITSVWGGGDRTEQAAARGPAARDPDAYQLEMGLTAFAAGGATGVGLGNSLLKYSYLPENHTDFILAMIGEELGLAATMPCLLVFLAMAAAGLRVAHGAEKQRERLFALGLALHLCLSGAVNVGVVTGALPTKGLALPFLSYGGSNLVASLLAGGLLLGVAWGAKPRRGRFEDDPVPPPPPRGEPLASGWGL